LVDKNSRQKYLGVVKTFLAAVYRFFALKFIAPRWVILGGDPFSLLGCLSFQVSLFAAQLPGWDFAFLAVGLSGFVKCVDPQRFTLIFSATIRALPLMMNRK